MVDITRGVERMREGWTISMSREFSEVLTGDELADELPSDGHYSAHAIGPEELGFIAIHFPDGVGTGLCEHVMDEVPSSEIGLRDSRKEIGNIMTNLFTREKTEPIYHTPPRWGSAEELADSIPEAVHSERDRYLLQKHVTERGPVFYICFKIGTVSF